MRRLRSLTAPLWLSFWITAVFTLLSLTYEIKPEWSPFLAAIAQKSLDYKFQLRGVEKPRTKIVIVAGDDKAFQKFGMLPWDRGNVMATLIDAVCKFRPRAFGLDFFFTGQEKLFASGMRELVERILGPRTQELNEAIVANSGDARMKRAIESCGGRVVMAYTLQPRDYGVPPEQFTARASVLLSPAAKNALRFELDSQGEPPRDRPYSDDDFSYGIMRSGLLNTTTSTPAGVAQGFVNIEPDLDGRYRRMPLVYRVGDDFVESLALRVAQKAASPDDTPPALRLRPKSLTNLGSLGLEFRTSTRQTSLPIDRYGRVLVNYRGPDHVFPHLSMVDLLSSDDSIEFDEIDPGNTINHVRMLKTELFKDAIVLMGVTGQFDADVRPRPFDSLASGVEIHATVVDNLLTGEFLAPLLARQDHALLGELLLLTFGLSLFFGWGISRLGAGLGALSAIVAVGGVLCFEQFWLFEAKRIVFFGQIQEVQLILQYIAITALKYRREERARRDIRSAFDKYVSPLVIDMMLKEPERLRLGGEKRELSVLFSDIRGFTTLSEALDVRTLTSLLNDYLGAMTEVLQANRGTLDKYIGDAVMGFWGAPLDEPGHAALAVKTAVEMLQKLGELNPIFQSRYGVTLDIGIGVNSGEVSVGNFGSSKVFEYTVIGDNVNLASRLEGVNKNYGTHILISQATFERLEPGSFVAREIDRVRVKGKQKPVTIYEVLPAGTESQASGRDVFEEGLSFYYKQKWPEAIGCFERVLKLRGGDAAANGLLERCRHFQANPPAPDWDGSWEMESK